jgi:hypothetical protein
MWKAECFVGVEEKPSSSTCLGFEADFAWLSVRKGSSKDSSERMDVSIFFPQKQGSGVKIAQFLPLG